LRIEAVLVVLLDFPTGFGAIWGFRTSSGDELRDAYEIVGDEIEQEIGTHDGNTAVLGLAHGAVLLALPQPKTHSLIARHDCEMR
jgi:hypothetical protein